MQKRRLCLVTLILAAASVSASPRFVRAQKPLPVPPAATPCVDSPERHQFDFWLGDWTVTTAGGEYLTGTSSIQRIAGGCALLENWTAVNGGAGKSINAYNPQTKQWQQYWIGQNGAPTEYRESEWQDKTLVFVARDARPMQRLSFTPLGDGSVRQFGEIWNDSTQTWKVAYDYRYHRKPESP